MSEPVMRLIAISITVSLSLGGCAGPNPKRFATPDPKANAPYLGVGTISGASGIGLMVGAAAVDISNPCPAALCIGDPHQDLLVEGIEIYHAVMDGRDVLVVRGKRRAKKGTR